MDKTSRTMLYPPFEEHYFGELIFKSGAFGCRESKEAQVKEREDDIQDTASPIGEDGDENAEFQANDEIVDEELMALSAPPPSPWYGVLTGIVILVCGGFLVWFVPDFTYFLEVFQEPTSLGEAPSVDPSMLTHNDYAMIDGIPRVNRSLDFSSVELFGRRTNSFFPLTGQNRIFVVWPQVKKPYGDGYSPVRWFLPGHFEGRLIERDSYLGRSRYRKLWGAQSEVFRDYEVPENAWILVDGEKPVDKAWVLLVYGVFIFMIVFNAIKLRRFIIAWRD